MFQNLFFANSTSHKNACRALFCCGYIMSSQCINVIWLPMHFSRLLHWHKGNQWWDRPRAVVIYIYIYRKISHQIPKLKCFSSALAVVFAQSIEAMQVLSRERRCSWSSADIFLFTRKTLVYHKSNNSHTSANLNSNVHVGHSCLSFLFQYIDAFSPAYGLPL